MAKSQEKMSTFYGLEEKSKALVIRSSQYMIKMMTIKACYGREYRVAAVDKTLSCSLSSLTTGRPTNPWAGRFTWSP